MSKIQNSLGSEMLELITTVKVSATTHFEAIESFRKDNLEGVKFSDLGSTFTREFLGDARYVEKEVPEAKLVVLRLTQPADDKDLLRVGVIRLFLAYLWELLKRQPTGAEPNKRDKVFLVNGCANIFEIRETDWSVSASWLGGGWRMRALHLSRPNWWYDGYQVFSSLS